MEIWKTIPDTFNLLEVSNCGRVRSLMRGKPCVLKTQINRKGYHKIRVTIKRIRKSYSVHRLVAQAFLDNPDNLPQVNHKDGNKNNNSVENLEWINNKDNAHHAIENGLWRNVFTASKVNNEKRKIPVVAIKENTCMHFKSISEAERYFDSRHIVDVLKGRREHVKGFSFVYESEVM